ncbi:gas vesicle protein GvpA/GvpJ/GvpM family [Yoonia maricola]|uniref:Gas vesicle protein GvpA/GvpJ/GvpM family n=1 Tax=Yoonia maricola TaxID=420999 RepID=A0A2M8WKH8_9RHOB|nr:gas vesicle protein GvpJ [Yoonia maricola]PJI91429.1 gas vesicle protein GvpA/GvpJ/GvpM family [Yoonia maricola]
MSLALEMATPQDAIRSSDTALVDVVDGLLRHGVVIRGELWLTVADVDLVFLGLDLLLASPDKMRPEGITR